MHEVKEHGNNEQKLTCYKAFTLKSLLRYRFADIKSKQYWHLICHTALDAKSRKFWCGICIWYWIPAS